MKMHRWRAALLVILTACSPPDNDNDSSKFENEPDKSQAGNTYILVHGASGGGWDWKIVDDLLNENGHRVYRTTLTGLGEKVHLSNPEIDLTTHINDIVNVILFEQLEEVVIVGHSYGGMVITGVMDEIPERIKHAIFLDAAVPKDGMSAIDLWGDTLSGKAADGIFHFSWLDPGAPVPRDVPQSLKTLTEPVSFNDPLAKKLPATYVAFIPPGMGLEERKSDPSWQIAEARGWTVKTLVSDHNAQRSHPRELVELLQESVGKAH